MSFSFSFPCDVFIEETGRLSCRVSHSLDFDDCIPAVSFNMFLCLCISCKLVGRSRGLMRFRVGFGGKNTYQAVVCACTRKHTVECVSFVMSTDIDGPCPDPLFYLGFVKW